MNHIIDIAKGALKLVALHMQHPNTVNRDQVAAATVEALDALNAHRDTTPLLHETYLAVRSVVSRELDVAVAPTSIDGIPLKVLIFDGTKIVFSTCGKTPAGLAEVVRHRLQTAA